MLAVLVSWNAVANLVVPGALEVPTGPLGLLVLVAMVRRAGITCAGIGLTRDAADNAPTGRSMRGAVDAFIGRHRDGVAGGGIGTSLVVWWVAGIGLFSLLIVGGVLAAYLVYVLVTARAGDPVGAEDRVAVRSK